MPRDVSVATQANADAEALYYTEIYNISVGDGTILRFTPVPPASGTGTIAFSFGGNNYQSFDIKRSKIKQTSDQELSGVTIEIQNTDQVIGAVIANNLSLIRGQTVTISGIMLSSGTNSPISNSVDDLIPVIDGTIGQIKVDQNKVAIQLNYDIEDTTVDSPRRFYSSADGFNYALPVG